jgi:hypothetical protein
MGNPAVRGASHAGLLSARHVGLAFLLLTEAGWGANWTILKFVLHDWPPLFARGVAGVLAAVLLGVVATFKGHSLWVPRSAWTQVGGDQWDTGRRGHPVETNFELREPEPHLHGVDDVPADVDGVANRLLVPV